MSNEKPNGYQMDSSRNRFSKRKEEGQKDKSKKRKVTYDGGNEVEGWHNQAEKKVVINKNKGEYTKHGWGKDKIKTKTTSVSDDTPYHGKKGQSSKQTLTKTKTVRKDNKETTKTKEKGISNKRAERIKKRIRKHDPSNKSKEAANAARQEKYG